MILILCELVQIFRQKKSRLFDHQNRHPYKLGYIIKYYIGAKTLMSACFCRQQLAIDDIKVDFIIVSE